MEFGPRALGCRSIIADPRSFEMQKKLNLKIKYRESFRPFAPSILIEDKNDWFDLKYESPYMLLVSNVKESKKLSISTKDEEEKGLKKLQVKRSKIPAVTHVDYSSRIQTVNKDTNPLFYSIISEFKKLTGCPIVVNTSFNIRGEPIVCNPEDAYNCFMGTNLDVLIIENYILLREKQNFVTNTQYLNKFELD